MSDHDHRHGEGHHDDAKPDDRENRDHDDEDHHDEEHHGEHDDHGHEHGESGTHDHHHHDVESLGYAVLTVSSSRGIENDNAGDAIVARFDEAGHDLVTRELVGDDHDTVQRSVNNLARRSDADCVVTTGGTGVTPDDVTVEAAEQLFDKHLPGFGELFRQRSYDEVGTMVVATRATAGIAEATPVFCLPGSENAATLGASLIVDVAGHLAGLARRDDDENGE